MDVEDILTRLFFSVEDDPVAALFYAHFSRQGSGSRKNAADHSFFVFRNLIESIEVVFGYKQDVDRSLRIDIFESQNVLVLIDHGGRDFFPYDFTEDTALGIHRSTL